MRHALWTLGLALLCLSPGHQLVAQARPATQAPTKNERRGFWFNIGMGYGSLDCSDCDGREGGLSGASALGGTLSQKVLVGGGTNGWFGNCCGVGVLTAQVRLYPSATGGFYLLGGLGVGATVDLARDESGFAGLLGLGYDFRVGKSVSLAPFGNWFSVSTSGRDAKVAQIGLGVTFH